MGIFIQAFNLFFSGLASATVGKILTSSKILFCPWAKTSVLYALNKVGGIVIVITRSNHYAKRKEIVETMGHTSVPLKT